MADISHNRTGPEMWTAILIGMGVVAMIAVAAICIHNLTADGPNGAWPFGGDW